MISFTKFPFCFHPSDKPFPILFFFHSTHKIQPCINQVIEHQIEKKKKSARNMAEDVTTSQDARKEQVSPTSIKNKSSRSSCNIYTIQKKKINTRRAGKRKEEMFPAVKMPLFMQQGAAYKCCTRQPSLLKSLARTLSQSMRATRSPKPLRVHKNAVSMLTRQPGT